MNSIDRHARKQVLLARIAFERIELRRDMERVSQAVRLPNLMRVVLGEGLTRSLFGSKAKGGANGWVNLALSLVNRWRTVATLAATLAPMLAARRHLPRIAKWGAVAFAAWFGWHAVRGRRDENP